jgi:hypothetical protein
VKRNGDGYITNPAGKTIKGRHAPPPPHLRELQALTRHLENLHETRQQQLNRLEGNKTKGVGIQC